MCMVRYLHQAIDPDAPPLAPQPKPSSPYRTVGCVFNHQTFLANCQPTDAVELCVFDFQVREWCPRVSPQIKYILLILHGELLYLLIIMAL